MIILITGVPGSGKTLYSIDLIRGYIADSRPVYTDITDLKLPGIVGLSPDDWRDTPDGSVVVYDECQQKFPPDRQGRSARADIAALEVHRHTGHDLILITQSSKLLHSHIRRLVGRHYHIKRLFGTSRARIYAQDESFDTESSSQLKNSDISVWNYPKKNFNAYSSAVTHNKRVFLPTFLRNSFIFGPILLIIIGVLFYYSFDFFSGQSSTLLASQPTTISTLSGSISVPAGLNSVCRDMQCVCFNKSFTVPCPDDLVRVISQNPINSL